MTTKSISRRYGVTEKKKAELDALTLQVLDAQQQVDQFQAIVTALTTKQNNFQALLTMADASRTSALANKNTVDQVVQNYLDLQNNSSLAFNAMALADENTKKLSASITTVMNKLIYSSEVINKLANYVVRKKALNPLVSDELVSTLAQSGTDANNAVALTLVALQSVFAAQATNMESESAFSLEYMQAMALYQLVTGTNSQTTLNANGDIVPINDPGMVNLTPAKNDSLMNLLHEAYEKAKAYYGKIHKALIITTQQLNNAQLALNQALITLQSLQSGLAAGNAAALA
jgi:hypothetical protein